MTWQETNPVLVLDSVPSDVIRVDDSAMNTTDAENVEAREPGVGPVAYLFTATEEQYNGIQSIDMTRVYDNSELDERDE